MANIAIFGGTFNPFHIGHYEMLSAICELSFIDKVLVMPDKIPPHKTFDNIVDDEHRKSFCKIVCEDFNKAHTCFIEFEREGKSYTIDTVNLLKEQYPNDDFYIVIGGDMLSTLDSWYNWIELIQKVSFIAFKRSGCDNFYDAYNRLINLGAKITVLENKITCVSSTQLRQTINSDLLPKKVYDYIIQKGIYNV